MTDYPAPKIIDVVATHGVPFRVTYGYRQYLSGKYSPTPVVSFYDQRYAHTEHGQFVSDYLLVDILTHTKGFGLDLYGGDSSWTIDQYTMALLESWLRNLR